jgi:SSS family transporter
VIVTVGLGYLLVCAFIAVWASRRTRDARDFFVAGTGIGLWPLAIASMAATLSGFAFIGGPGLLYTVGIGALFIVLPAGLTGALSAWLLGTRMRLLGDVRGLITVPDAIGARYRSRAAQGLSAVAILVATVGYLATNLVALGLIVDAVFHTGLTTGILVGSAVVVTYSVSGGILAGIYTDLFQGALMALASMLVFAAAMASGGGLEGISRTILEHQPQLLGPWGTFTPLAALSFFFVFGLGTLGQPHVIHKYYMLRDPMQLRWYPLLMTGALVLTLLLYFGVGVAMKAAVFRGDLPPLARADDATPTFLLRYTPPWLAGLVFSGVAAAIMSTVNSFFSVGAAALTHDLPKAMGRQVRDELRGGRVATLALAALATLLALQSGQLVALLGVFGWGLFASTLVPALAIGLNWPGATRKGALASMGVGLVATLLFETLAWAKAYSFPAGVTVSGLALVLAMATFFVVSLVTRGEAEGDLDADVRLIVES